MWNKPWRMQEGFVIGGGLICTGLMLELTSGGVVWDAFSWPANLSVLVGFVFLATLLFFLQPKFYFCLRPAADVLVGHQLPAQRPRHQRACVWLGD